MLINTARGLRQIVNAGILAPGWRGQAIRQLPNPPLPYDARRGGIPGKCLTTGAPIEPSMFNANGTMRADFNLPLAA
jgi:hypothetical protein